MKKRKKKQRTRKVVVVRMGTLVAIREHPFELWFVRGYSRIDPGFGKFGPNTPKSWIVV